jgi:hypothetical protein
VSAAQAKALLHRSDQVSQYSSEQFDEISR